MNNNYKIIFTEEAMKHICGLKEEAKAKFKSDTAWVAFSLNITNKCNFMHFETLLTDFIRSGERVIDITAQVAVVIDNIDDFFFDGAIIDSVIGEDGTKLAISNPRNKEYVCSCNI